MNLTAWYHDGFTADLLRWQLEASGGMAIVEATWFASPKRGQRTIELGFPDDRILHFAGLARDSADEYDGGWDDTSTYGFEVELKGQRYKASISEGTAWTPKQKIEVERFRTVWRPLSEQIESLLAIPGRS